VFQKQPRNAVLTWQVIFMLLLTLLLFSCAKSPDDPLTIYGKYRDSVVLVKNQYYYSITFDNGLRLFFTLNEKGSAPELYETENEAINHASTLFGTGFFVDRTGRIATNRHVVNPLQQGREAAEYIAKKIAEFKQSLNDKIIEKVNEQSRLKAYYEANYYTLDVNAISNIRQQYADLESQIRTMKTLLQSIYFNPDNTEIQVHVVDIGIAYDNTYVTSLQDFKSCVVLKQSDDEAVDLAVIQLKEKRTPEQVKYLISLDDDDVKKQTVPSINDDVYMIGYNYGLLLAITKEGIKSQFTAGKITQEPDGSRILYSIPTLPGSSGSPIIDKWGHLVAVNFAKITDTQSFSFGIPKKHLAELLLSAQGVEFGGYSMRVNSARESVAVPAVPQASSQEPAEPARQSSKDEVYCAVIRGFVSAEDSRDFQRLYGYFSENLIRYWDISNPTYSDMLNHYQTVWSRVSQSRNIITDIRKITDRTFDLYTEYEYYDLRKQATISKSSRVRYHLDGSGKIDEVYGVR
jgi:S1-C subfamily serine protease